MLTMKYSPIMSFVVTSLTPLAVLLAANIWARANESQVFIGPMWT